MATSEAQRRSPYQGLIPYEEADAPFFFGREKETRLIIANLFASPLTLLYGASGVGKSSVLRAGVAHQLRGRDELLVLVFNAWQSNPVADLKNKIAEKAGSLDPRFVQPTDSANLAEYLANCAEQVDRRLMIILDQFEEYFLYHPQEDEFATEFSRAVTQSTAPVSFLISIREDFYAKLDRFEGRIPTLYDNYLRIEHLDPKAARVAIEQPIAEYNRLYTTNGKFSIEPKLVDTVLKQVETGRVIIGEAGRGVIETAGSAEERAARIETPFLQLVMTRLWEKEQSDGSPQLRLNTLKALGGAENIVRTHLDTVITKLSERDQEIAAGIFHYLVTPSGTKIAYTAPDLAGSAELNEAEVLQVLEKLSHGDVRILRTVEPFPDRPTTPRYEIFHDVLAPAILTWRTAYVQAQERAVTEQKLAEEAAIQHKETLHQQALAAALQQKATAERQRSRQLKIGWVMTSVLLLFTVGSTVFAVNRWRKASDAEARATKALAEATVAKKNAEALLGFANDETLKATTARQQAETAVAEVEKQKREAELQKGEAERQKAEAEGQRGEAERQRGEAEKQKASAEIASNEALKAASAAKSAKWASDAKYQLTLNNPELALRLAIMAFDESATNDAQTILRQSYQAFAAQRILKGHGDVIRKAIYSPDGRFIFTASEDHTVKQWNALTNELVKTFEGHTGGVHDLAISADGRFLATEGSDSSGRIWNVKDGTSIQLADLSGPVAALAFSPDGRLLATEASESEEEAGWAPRIWDVRTGRIVHRLKGHTKAITTLAFSPDGKLLVTASWDHTARLWDTATGKEVKKLSGHTAPLASVAFSPNGKMVVTGSYDSTARIWDIEGQKEPIVLRGHTGIVQGVAFDPSGQYILTSGKKVRSLTLTRTEVPLPAGMLADDEAPDDNSVRLYDLTGRMVRQFSGHTGDTNSASFSQDGRLIVTASEDGTAKVWKVDTGEKILDVEPPGGPGQNYAVLSPDNAFLLASGANKTAQVWRVDPVGTRTRFLAQRSAVANVTFTDQNTVSTSGYDGVRLWDADTGSERSGGHIVQESVYAAAISPDGRLLVTGSKTRNYTDKTARLWKNGTAYDLGTHPSPVTRVSFSPQGTYILTLSAEAAKVWRTADRSLLRTFETDKNSQFLFRGGVAFSKDERYVAVGNSGGEVQVFDVTTGTLVTRIQEHSGAINSVAFNAETVDPLIVTSSDDGTARVCVATHGKCLLTLRDHTGRVTYAGFSGDNRVIVTIGVDRVARIWDAQRGNLVTAFTGYTQTPTSAALNLDGTRLAIGTSAGQVLISDCTVCRPIEQVRELAEYLKPRQLTVEESVQFLSFSRERARFESTPNRESPGSYTLTLTNNSSVDITRMHVAWTRTGRWDPDLVGKEILRSGGSFRITRGAGEYDLFMVDSRNRLCLQQNIPLYSDRPWHFNDEWLSRNCAQ